MGRFDLIKATAWGGLTIIFSNQNHPCVLSMCQQLDLCTLLDTTFKELPVIVLSLIYQYCVLYINVVTSLTPI
jgi:hypothetical protein